MAKSIKLGSDTYLDASGVYGFKGVIGSSADLNDLRYKSDSGMYYISGSPTNSPWSSNVYGMLLVLASSDAGAGFVEQVIFQGSNIAQRSRAGNPVQWGTWVKVSLSSS